LLWSGAAMPPGETIVDSHAPSVDGQALAEVGSDESVFVSELLVNSGSSSVLSESKVLADICSLTKLVGKDKLVSGVSDGSGSGIEEESHSPLDVLVGDLGDEGVGSLLLGGHVHPEGSVLLVDDSEDSSDSGAGVGSSDSSDDSS